MRDRHVWRHVSSDLQERPELAQRFDASLREYPNRLDRQQSRYQGQKSEGKVDRFPPKEKPPGKF